MVDETSIKHPPIPMERKNKPSRVSGLGSHTFSKGDVMAYNPYEMIPPEGPDTGYYCVHCGEMIKPDEDTWVWDGEYVCDEDCMRGYCRYLRIQVERLNKRVDGLVKEFTSGMLT